MEQDIISLRKMARDVPQKVFFEIVWLIIAMVQLFLHVIRMDVELRFPVIIAGRMTLPGDL